MLLSPKRLVVLMSLFKSFVVITIYKILSFISKIHKEYNYIKLIENEINQTTGSIILSNTSQTRNSIMYDAAFEMGIPGKFLTALPDQEFEPKSIDLWK